MIVLTPGHWHRFFKNMPQDLAQWECPICHERTNTPSSQVGPNGKLIHPMRHCTFFDIVKLEGWS